MDEKHKIDQKINSKRLESKTIDKNYYLYEDRDCPLTSYTRKSP